MPKVSAWARLPNHKILADQKLKILSVLAQEWGRPGTNRSLSHLWTYDQKPETYFLGLIHVLGNLVDLIIDFDQAGHISACLYNVNCLYVGRGGCVYLSVCLSVIYHV